MNGEDCRIGKDFNPKSCRYIKACRKGYSRNKHFKCVKNLNTTQKSMPVIKEKVKLIKDLFSNDNGLVNSPTITRSNPKHLKRTKTKKSYKNNSDGLVNSPPQLRSRSKHLKKTHKIHPSKINDKMPFRNPFEIELEQFIERNGEKLMKMTFGEAKAFARKEGFVLFSDKDKKIYKELLVDYRSKVSVPESPKTFKPENKGKLYKKVRFKPSSGSIKIKDRKVLSKRELLK